MSETDKYEKAIDTLGNLWIDDDDQAAAAYLREHFVTREEYEAKDGSVGEWMAQATALRIERDKFRAALKPFARVARIQGRWSMEWPDDKPNIEFIPSAWPDWGDFKRAELALNPENV